MSLPFFRYHNVSKSHSDFMYLFSFSNAAYLVLFLRFVCPPRQFRIQILKLAFAVRFLFICIFYSSIHIWLYTRTIDVSRDIEKNPGPRASSSQKFSICHWNLNNITGHSYVKISLLKGYFCIYKFPLHNVNLEIQVMN